MTKRETGEPMRYGAGFCDPNAAKPVETEKPEDFDQSKCTCHERDSSVVCDYCYSKGFRGHQQKGE